MHSKIRGLVFKLISICLGLLLGLLLAEGGMRYYLYGAKGFSYTALNSFKSLGLSGLIQRSENDSILWELQPNLDTLFKFAPFTTNSIGMRDKEYPKKKPAGTKRIIVIGDSFAMGAGVGDTENYPTILEELYGQTSEESIIEVLNFGVGGYNLRNYEAMLRSRALEYDPDLIVIGFCGGNDFELPRTEHLEGLLRIKPPLEMFYRSHLRRYMRLTNREVAKPLPLSKEQTAHVRQYFNLIRELAQVHNVPVVIGYHSIMVRESSLKIIRKLAKESGLYFEDLGASLANSPTEDLIFHQLDGHPSKDTHRVYAETLHAFLKRHLLLE